MKKSRCFVVFLLPVLLAAGPLLAQSGATLLQKAEALDRAGKFEAAQAAYGQARTAFSKAGDFDGQQKVLTELAAMDERMADQYLQQAGGGSASGGGTRCNGGPAGPGAGGPAPRRGAGPGRRARAGSGPAARPNRGWQAGRAVFFHGRIQ